MIMTALLLEKLEENNRLLRAIANKLGIDPCEYEEIPNECFDLDGFLRNLGVLHSKGYDYLKTAILLCIEDSEKVNLITKVLYPEIAKIHQVRLDTVEHCIRYAIKVAWNNKSDLMKKLFPKKPTNKYFIQVLTNTVKKTMP